MSASRPQPIGASKRRPTRNESGEGHVQMNSDERVVAMFQLHHRSLIPALVFIAGTLSLAALSGCGEDDASGDVTASQYVVPRNEKATPMPDPSVITVNARIPARLTGSVARQLELSDGGDQRKIISGKQIFRKEEYTNYVNSRKLRIEEINAPVGASIVQVDVSTDSPLELRSIPTDDRNKFVPAPVLHDDIGNVYWPIGYFHKDLDNDLFTIDIDLLHNFRDLNDLPPLSRSKRVELTLLYQVNIGVTLIGYSYGGYDRQSFSLTVDR
jgi:hypothetical protein